MRYYDVATQKRLTFLTNTFLLPALLVAQLYQCRWNIEVFFKWIKQHLRIKHFYGNSPNAVKTQIWIAVSVYLLVAIARKTLGVKASHYTFCTLVNGGGVIDGCRSPRLPKFQLCRAAITDPSLARSHYPAKCYPPDRQNKRSAGRPGPWRWPESRSRTAANSRRGPRR